MDRQTYNSCIAKGLKDKKLNKEERKLEFCILAKTCSGKAKDREEAKIICSQPKPPKERKPRKARIVRPTTERCIRDVKKQVEAGELPLGTNPWAICQASVNPETVAEGLAMSVEEEQTAADTYTMRKSRANKDGDSETAELYDHVIGEEMEHKREFAERLGEVR
jgi:hypothetical protein